MKLLSLYSVFTDECPLLQVPINVTFLIFSPCVDDTLSGVINHCSADHIGLLVYGCFNASITADSLKKNHVWHPETHQWVSKAAFYNSETLPDHLQASLALSQSINFQVTDIDVFHDTLSMKGSLLP